MSHNSFHEKNGVIIVLFLVFFKDQVAYLGSNLPPPGKKSAISNNSQTPLTINIFFLIKILCQCKIHISRNLIELLYHVTKCLQCASLAENFLGQ